MSERSFVQFLHPGGEHRPDREGYRSWNRGVHQRTFVRTAGRYLRDGQERAETLVFWGEWEPPVRVMECWAAPEEGYPSSVCEPVLDLPDRFDGHQNTDPFVFGECFLYGICQQHTVHGPTGMQGLARGSIVLFGSSLGGAFRLDTVFVVANSVVHTRDHFERDVAGVVPPTYLDAVLRPWYATFSGGSDDAPYVRSRLYVGATVAAPFEGMFSFFPCLPAAHAARGFPRPAITLPDRVNPTQRQGRKVTALATSGDARAAWLHVVSQVKEAGLRLGTFAALPPLADSGPAHARNARGTAAREHGRHPCG